MNYSTKDPQWACFLVYLGFPIIKKQSIDGRAYYIFQQSDAIDEVRTTLTGIIKDLKRMEPS